MNGTVTHLNERAAELLIQKHKEMEVLKSTNQQLQKQLQHKEQQIDYLQEQLVSLRHRYLNQLCINR